MHEQSTVCEYIIVVHVKVFAAASLNLVETYYDTIGQLRIKWIYFSLQDEHVIAVHSEKKNRIFPLIPQEIPTQITLITTCISVQCSPTFKYFIVVQYIYNQKYFIIVQYNQACIYLITIHATRHSVEHDHAKPGKEKALYKTIIKEQISVKAIENTKMEQFTTASFSCGCWSLGGILLCTSFLMRVKLQGRPQILYNSYNYCV